MKAALVPSQLSALFRGTDPSGRLLRGAGVLTVIQVAGLGLGYVSQILFARWLGTREYGIYAYVVGWTAVLAVLPTLGLPDAALRLVPEYLSRQDRGRLRGVIRGSWNLSLAVGFAFALAATVFLLVLNSIRPVEYLPEFLAGVWTVPLLACVNLQLGLSRGIKQVAAAFAPNIVLRPLLLVVAAFLLLSLTHALTSLMVLEASLLVLPLVLVMQFLLFRRDLPNLGDARPLLEMRAWLKIAIPLLLVSIFTQVILQTGLIAVGALSGPVNAGLFSAAYRTSTLLALILSMTNAVAAPLIAALQAQGDYAELQRLTSTVTLWAFWSSLALAVVLIIFAGPALALFGRDFVAARPVLAILTVGQLVNTGTGPGGTLLNMTGRQRTTLRITFWIALLSIILSFAGVYLWGILGAAAAAATTMVIWQIWVWRTVSKEMGIEASIFYALGFGRRRT